jgi:uncharacterized protein (DUF2237 family)
MAEKPLMNVLGTPLEPCCSKYRTGFYRDGLCRTGDDDRGRHVVCARMTRAFLDFSLDKGNDLITPLPQFDFPGLQEGDCWCLCALRWKEAFDAGFAPPVNLLSTHESALQFMSLASLKQHAELT